MKKLHPFNYRHLLVIAIFAFPLFSCQKDFGDSITTNSQTKDGFPNQPFDWENSLVMMPSLPAGPLNPSLPWTSQSGSYIDPNIISDYKRSDGWELVYNTFHPNFYTANASSGGLYFALYNKYRGLLRYYLFIPSGQFGGGVNIEHGLSIYSGTGNTTSILNFEGSDIVDPTIKNPSFVKTNNVGIAQGGGWYAMQYEIAYDPNFANFTYPNLGIAWNSRTVSISNINIAGTNIGTLNGNIIQQANDGTGSSIINGVFAAAEITGLAISGGTTQPSLLAQAVTSGLSGNLTGFFSNILGGNSNNSQEVDLKMNSTINLTGTISTPNALSPNTFVFPGETITANNGSNPPLYNNSLGVFNLTGRPTIHVSSTKLSGKPNNPNHPWDYRPSGDYYLNTMTVDQSVLNSIFVKNPTLNQTANVSIVNQEILLENIGDFFYQTVPVIENVGNITVWHGNTSFDGIKWDTTVNNGPVLLRVTVLVSSPTNAFPSIKIIKTFVANVI